MRVTDFRDTQIFLVEKTEKIKNTVLTADGVLIFATAFLRLAVKK